MLPERIELTGLEREESELEEQVTSVELALETLKTDLAQFNYRYHCRLGRLYLELDELEARIASIEAECRPHDPTAQSRARQAEQKARQTAEDVGVADRQKPLREITAALKQAYRKATKLMHPDRATSDRERERRTMLMARVNRAYEAGDLSAIEQLIDGFGRDVESESGDDEAARLIKTIRRIEQLRRRLVEAEREIAERKRQELYELMTMVYEAERQGGDPLSDLARQIERQITDARLRLNASISAYRFNGASESSYR
ncbi:MAG: hypothetical protein Kow0065_15910 [Methylomicrobium sp.]